MFQFCIQSEKNAVTSLFLLASLSLTSVFAQNVTVRGVVQDSRQETIIGASVTLKQNKAVGTVTDANGRFTLAIPSGSQTLVVSYVGMETLEVEVQGNKEIVVTLSDKNLQLEEVVVVGFGQQKKASVVGAITQTNSQVLERTGGVSSLGQALTGNLPGLVTMVASGKPGE